MTLTFYDLSNHQAGLKLSSLDSDAFIFKATEGLGFVDRECNGFVEQAKALGKPWGVYHFLDGSDVIKQAEFFYSNIKNYVGQGILVLDYEMYGRQGAVKAKQFLEHLYALTGVRAWIYMNESDSNADNWQPLAEHYALWIAKYSSQQPNHIKGLNIIAWQYTSTPLDKNWFYGDVTTWQAYANGGSQTGGTANKPSGDEQGPGILVNKWIQITDKNYVTYNSFGFDQMLTGKQLFGMRFNVRTEYKHKNGATYYSLFSEHGEWFGYINANATKPARSPQGSGKAVNYVGTVAKKGWSIYSGFDWNETMKSDVIYDKPVRVKTEYNHENGSKYLSLYDGNDKWVGYVNEDALKK